MNLLLKNIPNSIATERLLVRQYQPGDGASINAAALESHADLKMWLPWAQTIGTVEDTEMFIRTAMADWILRKHLAFGVFNKNDSTFIAHIGLHDIDLLALNAQIGYWIRSSCAGQGYITEAIRALIRFSFQELSMQRLEIRCDVENVKSRAVAERLGFEREGILKQNRLNAQGTTLQDTVIYARFDDKGL